MLSLGGRRTRMRTGVAALAVAGAVLAAALASGVGAAEEAEPATISRQAYFTYPATQITPPVIRNGFPPATVCLVAGLVGAAQLCGEDIQNLGSLLGLSDGLPIPVTPDGDLAQLVLPGTTPVGMLGGQARYVSLFQLALPPLPEGEGFTSFELVLHQDGLNFALESPAVRALVLSIMGQVSEQDPAKLLEEVAATLSGGELLTDTVTGIEACPAVEPWNGGPAQGAALDGTRLPDTDCILGTTGVYDEGAGTWTFDLTFAAQAWTEGAPSSDSPLANEGILLRPVGAPNLAYGDPDLSTNWVVSLADGGASADKAPRIRYATAPVDGGFSDEPPPDDGFDPGFDLGDGPIDLGLGSGGLDLGPIAAPSAPPSAPTTGANLTARWADREPAAAVRGIPAWAWLAVPLSLLGLALFGQALTAPALATRRRPGALSRLTTADPAASPRSST